jgi:hypothetical protein
LRREARNQESGSKRKEARGKDSGVKKMKSNIKAVIAR